MEIELWQLQNIIEAAAKKAVAEVMNRIHPGGDEINWRQACDIFGRGWLENAESLGLVKPIRAGKSKNSPKIYSRTLLMELKYGADPLLKAVIN